jgi:hypothetical protein
MCDLLVIQVYFAVIRLYEPHHHIESGGFACTVWTKQSNDLTLPDLNGHLVYHRPVAVLFDEIFSVNDQFQG